MKLEQTSGGLRGKKKKKSTSFWEFPMFAGSERKSQETGTRQSRCPGRTRHERDQGRGEDGGGQEGTTPGCPGERAADGSSDLKSLSRLSGSRNQGPRVSEECGIHSVAASEPKWRVNCYLSLATSEREGLAGSSAGKETAGNTGGLGWEDLRDPAGGHGTPLQHSCLDFTWI